MFKHESYRAYAREARDAGFAALGQPTVFLGNLHNPNLTVHQLANALLVAMFDASQVAPGNLKNQILAFQEETKTLFTQYLKEATRLEGERIGLMLESAGHSTAASFVRQTIIT